jgi:hypothetical protein
MRETADPSPTFAKHGQPIWDDKIGESARQEDMQSPMIALLLAFLGGAKAVRTKAQTTGCLVVWAARFNGS